MQFVYRPDGVDQPRVWPFEPRKILFAEAEVIEKVTGMTNAEWADAAMRGSTVAQRAYLWAMLKRSDPTLRIEAVQPLPDEMSVRFTREDFEKLPRPDLELLHAEMSKMTLEGDDAEQFAAIEAVLNADPTQPTPSETTES